VSSVAGRQGAVVLAKADVGLSSVDNTSDALKPVSTAQQAALSSKADLVGGFVPTSQLPGVALTTGQAVASRAAMLALVDVQEGDIVSITTGVDQGTFLLGSGVASSFTSWLRLSTPTDVVTTVNGQQGTVVLGRADVGLANVDNTSDANKPVSTAQQTAIAGRVPLPTGNNTRFGDNAQTSAAMVGVNNNAFGKQTQLSLTTGIFNNAFGNDVQRDLTTGGENTAVGDEAHRNLSTGSVNSAFGRAAQWSLQAGNSNTAVGAEVQYSLSSGSNNNAVGVLAQRSLTTGIQNNAVGSGAQYSPLGDNTFATTTGLRQVSVGHETGQNTATQLDAITTVGHHATAGANEGTALGAFSRADHAGSVALGSNTQTTAAQQVAVGPRALLVGDSATVPSVNPVAGGVLYAQNGSLVYRGSGGGITVLADSTQNGPTTIFGGTP
jgi:hypothetical protein